MDELREQLNCTNNGLDQWVETEKACVEGTKEGESEGAVLDREAVSLYRQLEKASEEQARVAHMMSNCASEAQVAQKYVEISLKALHEAHGEEADAQRNLDRAHCALYTRQSEVESLNENIHEATSRLHVLEEEGKRANEGLGEERAVGKMLQLRAVEAQKQSDLETRNVLKALNLLESVEMEKKQADEGLARAQKELQLGVLAEEEGKARAIKAAQDLEERILEHNAITQALETHEQNQQEAAQDSTMATALVHSRRAELRHVEQSIQCAMPQKERKCKYIASKESVQEQLKASIQTAVAECQALQQRQQNVTSHLDHHEETLHLLDYKLFASQREIEQQRRAILALSATPETLKHTKKQLLCELDTAQLVLQRNKQELRSILSAVAQVSSAAAQASSDVSALHTTAIPTQEAALHRLEKQLQCALSERDTVQLAVDRASLELNRSRQRLDAQGREALAVWQRRSAGAQKQRQHVDALHKKYKELDKDYVQAKTALHQAKMGAATAITTSAIATAVVTTLQPSPPSLALPTTGAIAQQMEEHIQQLKKEIEVAEGEIQVLEVALQAQCSVNRPRLVPS